MPIQGLPTFTLPGQEFSEIPKELQTILSKILEGKQNAQKLSQDQQANEQLNKYRMGEMGIHQQNADLSRELQPLKLNLLKEKINQIKNGGNSDLTRANTTKNQSIVQSVDNLMPQFDSLVESDFPGQLIGKYRHPSDQADYDAKVLGMSEALAVALNYPRTNQGLAAAEKIVRMRPFEDRKAYIARINKLKNDLVERKRKATVALKTENVFGENEGAGNEGGEGKQVRKYNLETGSFE